MITKTTLIGPNVKRLICERAAQIQVEDAKKRYGSAGVGEVAQSLVDGGVGGLQASMRAAFDWVAAALDIARKAPGSEKWPTDEDMAAEILRGIEKRRSAQDPIGYRALRAAGRPREA